MTARSDQVELLNPFSDTVIGTADKWIAHKTGAYHRAISILLLDPSGRHVLHQRASGKYHCPAMWTNSCCTHPYPGETSAHAARRRLVEELGLSCELFRFGTIRYRADVPGVVDPDDRQDTLVENERVALFCGVLTGEPAINPEEVAQLAAMTADEATALARESTTPWFRLYMEIFGGTLERIVRSCGEGSWTKVDYGRFDLDHR